MDLTGMFCLPVFQLRRDNTPQLHTRAYETKYLATDKFTQRRITLEIDRADLTLYLPLALSSLLRVIDAEATLVPDDEPLNRYIWDEPGLLADAQPVALGTFGDPDPSIKAIMLKATPEEELGQLLLIIDTGEPQPLVIAVLEEFLLYLTDLEAQQPGLAA